LSQSLSIEVIIATYNRRSTLKEAVVSAINQTPIAGVELHTTVVDDGSLDHSFECLLTEASLELVEVEPGRRAESALGLTVLRIENVERGAARNAGANLARDTRNPNWFLFLDSDDRLSPTAVLRFAQSLRYQAVSPILVYSWFAQWNGRQSPTLLPQHFRVGPPGDISELVITETFVALGATLIASSAFFEAGQFPEPRELAGSEDKILLTRLALKGPVLFCRQVAVWYREHAANTNAVAMIESIDRIQSELSLDVQNRFGERAQSLQIGMSQHSHLKKIGHSIFSQNRAMALRFLFFRGLAETRKASIVFRLVTDSRYWRLWLSFFAMLIRPKRPTVSN
jgi:glycosyltransferase involved in cell wall biosynthesis